MSSTEEKLDRLTELMIAQQGAPLTVVAPPMPIQMSKLLPMAAVVMGFVIQTAGAIWWLSKADTRITTATNMAKAALSASEENTETLNDIQTDVTVIKNSVISLVADNNRSEAELSIRRPWMDDISQRLPKAETLLQNHEQRLIRIEDKLEKLHP